MAGPPGLRNMRVTSGDGFVAKFARFWQQSYASDYVGLIILFTGYMTVQLFMQPFHRMFFLDNLAIQYPHALVERVPVLWLFLYSIAIPSLSILIWILFTRPAAHKAHVTLLGLFISLILAAFVTDVIKNAVGRPRPDLIDRCKPAKGTPSKTLVTWEICTQTNQHTLHDGWRSFPSGHSSFAFSGLGYLSLFLAGQLYVFRPRTDLARVLLALIPLLGAALIAISRCEDYRHDVYDVTVGSMLGLLLAHFSYRRYFPPLGSSKCNVPYPLLLEKNSGKVKDEEETVESAWQFQIEEDDGSEAEHQRLPLSSTRH